MKNTPKNNFTSRPYNFFIDVKCLSGNSSINKRTFGSYVKEHLLFKKNLIKKEQSITLKIIFFFLKECPCDIDNLLKSLLDSLQGKVYENDRTVKEIHAKIEEFSYIEGVSVAVKKYSSFSRKNEFFTGRF